MFLCSQRILGDLNSEACLRCEPSFLCFCTALSEKRGHESFRCCVGLTAARVPRIPPGAIPRPVTPVVVVRAVAFDALGLRTRCPHECRICAPDRSRILQGIAVALITYCAFRHTNLCAFEKTSRISLTCSTTITRTTRRTTFTASVVPVVLAVRALPSLSSPLTVSNYHQSFAQTDS